MINIAVVVFGAVELIILPLCIFFFQRYIKRRDAEQDRKEREKEAKQRNLEAHRRKNEILTVKGVFAAIALSEETARVVKSVYGTECNGQMNKALELAKEVKEEQNNFLTEQGLNSIY